MKLKNKVAVITGSSGGIGKSIAQFFAAEGARVFITSRSLQRAQDIAREIIEQGGDAHACRFELEDTSTIDSLLESVMHSCGRLDILVNNALSHPTLPPLPLQEMNKTMIESGITTNLTNTMALTGSAHRFLQQSQGVVLNIGSAVVNRYMLGIPLYSVVKGGLTQMTKTLAAEWARDGIRVNQINPGVVKTEAYRNIGIPAELLPMLIEHYSQCHPLGRVGEPQDVAALATFIVSDDASWMSGSILDIDGAYSCQGVAPLTPPQP